MDVTYKVKLTTQAIEELDLASQYIANDLQQPEIANHWLDTMQCEIRSLSYLPGRFPLVEDEPFRSIGVHKMKVKNYRNYIQLVYFMVRILYVKMSWEYI